MFKTKLKTSLLKWLFTFVMIFVFTCLVIVPDFLLDIFHTSPVRLDGEKFLQIFIFMTFLVLVTSRRIRLAILIFIGIFYCLELCHLAFFGEVTTPYTYIWMASELVDTVNGALDSIHLIYAPLCLILPFALIFYLDKKFERKMVHKKWANYVISLVFIYMIVDVNRTDRSFFYMVEKDHTLGFMASIRKLNFIYAKAVPKLIFGGEVKTFKPYTIEKIKVSDKVNIIYIFGESANPQFMSLYGYENKTTPLLDKYKGDKSFYYKKGFSSSVSTVYSVFMAFYMQREPENYNIQKTKEFDIMRLAKEAGFKSWWIGVQSTTPEYQGLIDNVKFIQTEVSAKGEEVVVDYLPEVENLGDKNIIFYQQNIMHFDYKDHYVMFGDKWNVFEIDEGANITNQKVAEYNNSVLYWDFIMNNIFDYADKISVETGAPTYIIFTSDHGELIGGSKRGHSALSEEVATIPVFAKCFNCKGNEMDKFFSIETPTHYRINEKLLNIMGYNLINPNDDGKTFYINGKSLYGDDGFITLKDK